ncbi:hypothetical protein C8E89_10189 [Mycolicibacterium moriokaense]|uniref:Uncharacterized protein n=1 Tax=Mycolicibacterium moriokaense TaxID=39691 RepID=A0A318I2K8_9MYCO|nr:hypothetical protein C8E89_10189 [Mycolicibacterium moriokaense]
MQPPCEAEPPRTLDPPTSHRDVYLAAVLEYIDFDDPDLFSDTDR